MRKILWLPLLFMLFSAAHALAQGPVALNTDSLKKVAAEIKKANQEKAAKTKFQFFIIRADSATYGYSIYADGQLYIWQTNIPGMPGAKGFANHALATKCAELIIQKIKKGEMPPSLTEEELKKNHLIN
ncbi:MAG: DUF4907 domain-containing protein [Chitinophagaceae bacterium]|nr:DUF4907 domain-containing protein [Chitinophagaceae bacterium]